MADTEGANANCPVCKLPVGESKHFCHLCRRLGATLLRSEPCGADHLVKMHTQDQIDPLRRRPDNGTSRAKKHGIFPLPLAGEGRGEGPRP